MARVPAGSAVAPVGAIASGPRPSREGADLEPTPLLLGIDVGTSRIKAMLLAPDGGETAVAAADTPWIRSGDGSSVDADILVGEVAAVVRRLDRRQAVAAVGVAGMAESGVPVDPAGRALAPLLAWYDPRGTAVAERLGERFGPDLAERIGQRPRAVSSAAKLGWLVDHGCRPAGGWLGVPELLLHRLTGERSTEHSLAARTGWYDVRERRWMPEVAVAVGLPAALLPAVGRAGEALGCVAAAVAASWGLPAGVPVTIAGHDHLAGATGAAARPEELVDSTGTAESVVVRRTALPDVRVALEARVAVSLWPGGHSWALLASAARSGMVLQRAASLLGSGPAALDARVPPGPVPPDEALLEALGRDGDPPEPPADPAAAWAGLLEALAERTGGAVRRLERTGVRGRTLLVIGGGAASMPWLRAKARRCPLPVERVVTAAAVARGAAAAAGVAAGWWPELGAAPAPRREGV